MAQVTRTTGNVQGVSFSATDLNNLEANFATGQIINRSAILTLIDYFADIDDHTHNVTDERRRITFGNNGSAASNTEDTQGPSGMPAVPADPSSASTITASKHNQIRNAINALRGHVHVWDDDQG